MVNKIKKIFDGEGNQSFPITIPQAVILEGKITLDDKLRELSQGNNTYIIELDRFGITEGMPPKPYVTDNYYMARANIIGINNALKFASKNNYTQVILPKGMYAICYPIPIQMQSYVTFNLNGSTLKVLYDSDVRSPFDTATIETYWFGGVSIEFRDVTHSHLINGKVIGEMYDRSFLQSGEVAVEGTYGVSFTASSNFCSLTHCELAGYAGDPISFSSYGANQVSMGSVTLEDLDATTGLVTTSTNTLISGYIAIPKLNYKYFNLRGLGGYRSTSAINKEYQAYFYRSDGSFMGRLISQNVTAMVRIPIEATTMRLKFLDEPVVKDMQMVIDFGGFPHNCLVEYNEIYDGHRGGITLGGNYNTVQHNLIRENGKFSNTFIDGKPTFNDPTRYAINQEDSYGHNCVIRNNYITGGYHGILITGWSTFIENNVINNMDSLYGIVLYDMQHGHITGNYMVNAGIYLSGSGLKPSTVQIFDNFIKGKVNIANSTYDIICRNNHIITSGQDLEIGNAVFENNTISFGTGYNAIQPATRVLKDNIFKSIDSSIKPLVYIKTKRFIDCEFTGLDLSLNAGDAHSIEYDKCKFTECILKNHTSLNHKVTLKECEVKDTVLQVSAINSSKNVFEYNITKCIFESTKNTHFFYISSNTIESNKWTIEKSTFSILNSSFVRLIEKQYGIASSSLVIRENAIEYQGLDILNTEIASDSVIFKSVIVSNKKTNIIIPTLIGDKHLKYDPEYKSIIEPVSGFFYFGQIISHGQPSAGGYMGWICLTEGIANNVNWVTNTAYVTGQLINANNKVYKCTVAGTSGTTAPSNTTGTTTDGTVTWQYVSTLASFKPYGLISE